MQQGNHPRPPTSPAPKSRIPPGAWLPEYQNGPCQSARPSSPFTALAPVGDPKLTGNAALVLRRISASHDPDSCVHRKDVGRVTWWKQVIHLASQVPEANRRAQQQLQPGRAGSTQRLTAAPLSSHHWADRMSPGGEADTGVSAASGSTAGVRPWWMAIRLPCVHLCDPCDAGISGEGARRGPEKAALPP